MSYYYYEFQKDSSQSYEKKLKKIPHYSKKICIFAAEFFNKLTIILL